MGTKSIESAPVRFNYYNGGADPTATGYAIVNPRGAYTDGESVLFYYFASSESYYGKAIYDGFSFNGLQADSEIVGYKVRCKSAAPYAGTSSSQKAQVYFTLVTDYHNGQSNSSGNSYYTAIGSQQKLYEKTARDVNYSQVEYEDTEPSSAVVIWLNNNISKIIQGNAFGIRMRGQGARFKELKLELLIKSINRIYRGGVPVSAVYVSGTPAKAVYLGSTKIL